MRLPNKFISKTFEPSIYKLWEKNNCFAPQGTGTPYIIVIPPPNVTGILHMGHGLNNTLQDILIRYMRMMGRKTLWIPGSDHAGIATQSVVERMLQKEQKSSKSLGREAFIQRTWEVCNAHKKQITEQLKMLGSSCDWSRYRFTLDPDLSHAVSKVFIQLYEQGLIYKGSYMVNWLVNSQTAISNEEVEYKEKTGKLYVLRYPFADNSGEIQIATTRPETIFGDTAVAVHPDDARYSAYIGKTLIVPFTSRIIPLITDTQVDPEFGTGALKITPAHDNKDYEIGLRNNLEVRITMTPHGTLNELVPEQYQGLDMQTARKKIADDLEHAGFMVRAEQHIHQVGYCHRTGDIIEPYPSTQWFVKMKPLVKLAKESWDRGELSFHPARWANTYLHWLDTTHDWCISRQLWWGHRIPAWYDNETGDMVVSETDPSHTSAYQDRTFTQDESVLDTWFSSWLWPFSTMGWPEDTTDLTEFYPTSTLITGYDIIFFWVARMVMAGLKFQKQSPFRDVYITNLIRDKTGRKMSKSLGNGIDPRTVIDTVGADALRFTLAFHAAQGGDMHIGIEDFQFGSKFTHKIWNAARFILMHVEDTQIILSRKEIEYGTMDKWIWHRLAICTKEVHAAFGQHRFNEAAKHVYEYFWNDFCDWYLEGAKVALTDKEHKNSTISSLIYLLDATLRLLHPFIPFITEEIYQHIPATPDGSNTKGEKNHPFLITAAYPQYDSREEHPHEVYLFTALQEVVRTVRTIRSEFNIAFNRPISFAIYYNEQWPAANYILSAKTVIAALTNGEDIQFDTTVHASDSAIVQVQQHFEAHVHIKDIIDIAEERRRLKRSREKKIHILQLANKKIHNEHFLNNAPKEIIDREITKVSELTTQVEKIDSILHSL